MNTYKRMPKAQAGFTLIEIMVVVIIIGLLSTLVAPAIFKNQEKAQRIKAQNDINALASQLDLYRLDIFSYPSTSEGLQALITNPGKPNWTGYGKKAAKDPWGNAYQYQNPGTRNSNSYDLWSFGSDNAAGGEGSAKDIGNWEETN